MAEMHRVVLTVPPVGEFARTVRLAAAELATLAGMNIDDVDDVKLAVDEVFVFAHGCAGDADITFDFSVTAGELTLLVGPLPDSCTIDAADEPSQRYARFILESICDEYEALARDGASWVHLVKRA